MSIKQLKKEFDEKFYYAESYTNEVWDWIEKEAIPKVIKEMLVEEREVKKGFDSGKSLIEKSEDIGHNQCCAIGRKNERKIKKNI